eukprot:m51a1_g5077 putative dipeptidyl peptidase 3 isoform x1 (698) ;mRNA; r:225948-228925
MDPRVPSNVPFCQLDCSRAWEGLSEAERQYAHHLSRASWAGAPICLHQTSPESPAAFALVHRVFRAASPRQLREDGALAPGAADAFVEYAASLLGNMGNYLSFGDTKFIPRCTKEEWSSVAESAARRCASPADAEAIRRLLAQCVDGVFALDPPRVRQLGFGDDGVSAYYEGGVSRDEAALAQRWLERERVNAYNTRVGRARDGGLVVRVASALPAGSAAVCERADVFEGRRVSLRAGDLSPYLARVAGHLREAAAVAPREGQARMLRLYAEHFEGGDVERHRDAQREWVRDKSPAVETNIGFIESYRDPLGVRAEWEGLVAIVDRETSKAFGELVERAPQFLSLLPWGHEFEKDVFLRPDFTAIEVLSFASSGVPLGINLPNYEDIRQKDGFKNVSLSNAARATPAGERVEFVSAEDDALIQTKRAAAMEVQVGLHELLGHGSGKIFVAEKAGVPPAKLPVSPLTGRPIATWYEPGQTYESVFGEVASTMEECRAESVGLLLSTSADVLRIFGHADKACQDDVTYVNWLMMARAGVASLEYYTAETGRWRQAHMQARYAILRTLLAAGQGLVAVTPVGDSDVVVSLDRSKIASVGVPAIRGLLNHIQHCRATADAAEARAFYGSLTSVAEEHWLAVRARVIAKAKPRKIFVQAHTYIDAQGKVQAQWFDASPDGVIASFQARYPEADPVDTTISIL